MSFSGIDLITILGPTASGKTKLAVQLAHRLSGEIISADSRQVFKEMNIGTGKDYEDYLINEGQIPYHLIDIAQPGSEFNIFHYQRAFTSVYKSILSKKKIPILCGGSGLYLDAVLKGFKLINISENIKLREELKDKSLLELVEILSSFRKLHSTTDSAEKSRAIRAIEIETFMKNNPDLPDDFPKIRSFIVGVAVDRKILRDKITFRLEKRLKEGMIEEVEQLIAKGVPTEKLKQYGLEYKFITMYLLGEINYDTMFTLLNTSIHQFAKRQMTWFRRMEKTGLKIHWVNGTKNTEEIMVQIMALLNAAI